MNIPANSHFRPWTVFVAIISLSILIGCDDTRTSIGGSGDETSTVAFYRPDGKPAAGARVMIYGSADTGASPRDQVIADSRGSVDLPVLDKGFYNLVVREDGTAIFQDSLFSNGERILAASDTLRATGVLVGRLRVQPQHSPRIAWVHLLGAGKYLNVDDSGFFRMEGVPQGRFTMAALTRLSHYTPTFKEVRAVSDSVVDVGTIELVYTGLPVVQNLEARFDTLAGRVFLRWDSLSLRAKWHYRVLRDEQVVGETSGPRWVDTVSDELPADLPKRGIHTYRVEVADADTIGPKWESITLQVISPMLYEATRIGWDKKSDLPWPKGSGFQLDTLDGQLVAWRSAEYETKVTWAGESQPRLLVSTGLVEKWTSPDGGATWSKVADSLPIGAFPIRWRGNWWSVRATTLQPVLGSATNADQLLARPSANVVVVRSDDGVHWDSVETLSAGVQASRFRMEAAGDTVWICGSNLHEQQPNGYLNSYIRRDVVAWWSTQGNWNSIPQKEMASEIYWQLERDRPFRTDQSIHWELSNWDGGWWRMSGGVSSNWEFTVFNGLNWRKKAVWQAAGYDDSPKYLDIGGPRVLRMGEAWLLVFGGSVNLSVDTGLSIPHAISWPGSGYHFERFLGGKVVSVSDAGVYVGTILPPGATDARGSWTKSKETPVLF